MYLPCKDAGTPPLRKNKPADFTCAKVKKTVSDIKTEKFL